MFIEDMAKENEEYESRLREEHLGLDAPEIGDPLVDFWNRQLARGEVPDLSLGDPVNAAKRDRLIREKAKQYYEETGELIYVPPIQTRSIAPDDYEERVDFLDETQRNAFDESLHDEPRSRESFEEDEDLAEEQGRENSRDVSSLRGRKAPRAPITGKAFDAFVNASKKS